jgi:two-component system cell cycle response regulator
LGIKVLVVDDSRTQRAVLTRALKGHHGISTVLEAENGVEALKVLASDNVDLVLSDIIMPKMDGYGLLRSIDSHKGWDHIPFILLTSKSDLDDRVKGLREGAWDYLVKPVNPVELLTRIQVMLRIKSLQDKLKSRIHHLERLSIVDALTGLYNKKYLFDFIKGELKRSVRYGLSVSCLMIDIDHFKEINDEYGHPCADHLLKQLGGMMGEMIRGYDFAARFGGDEFTVILPQQRNREDAFHVAERIRKRIENHTFHGPSRSKNVKMKITLSVGVAGFPDNDTPDSERLMEKADEALYRAKSEGRNRTVLA